MCLKLLKISLESRNFHIALSSRFPFFVNGETAVNGVCDQIQKKLLEKFKGHVIQTMGIVVPILLGARIAFDRLYTERDFGLFGGKVLRRKYKFDIDVAEPAGVFAFALALIWPHFFRA